MGISTILAGSHIACLLGAVGYWMRICKAQGTDSMFVDHFPLVLYVGVLKHEAIRVSWLWLRFASAHHAQRTSLIWAFRCGFGLGFLLGVVC